jgi:Flp pilus assembly protein TadD
MSNRSRKLGAAVGGVLVLVAAGGWWYYSTQPSVRLARGQSALRLDDFVRAEAYAELLKSSGDLDRYRLLMGEIALRRKSPATALEYLAAIPPESPVGMEAAIRVAQATVALRRPFEAMSALYFVLQKNPQHVEAHRWLATIYYDQGDYLRTIPHLEKVAELDPSDARPHRLLGLIYRDLDKLDDAIAAYSESLRRNPHPPDEEEVRVEMAVCLLRVYREAEAIDAVAGWDTPAAAAIRAEAMLALGHEQQATELLDRELTKHPDYIGLLRLRGERFLAAGQPEQAVAILERVVREAPHDLRSRTQLARAYHLLGRTADAEAQNREVQEYMELIQKVHDKNIKAMEDPWDAVTRRELADLCEKIHRPELARMWRRAAEAAQQARR